MTEKKTAEKTAKTPDEVEAEKAREFYEKNKDMIDRIVAEKMARDSDGASEDDREYDGRYDGRDGYDERRSGYEDRYGRSGRAAYMADRAGNAVREGADRLDHAAREGADRAYDTYRYGRDRTADAFDDARDYARSFAHDQTDYAYRAAREERARTRARFEEEREYARSHADEDLARAREDRDRARRYVSEGLDDTIGFLADPKFQQHLVGAGIEAFMALNSLIRAGPFPDSFKNAAEMGDRNKNVEYCRKNPYYHSKKNPDAPRYREGDEVYKPSDEAGDTGAKKIIITPKGDPSEKAGADRSKKGEKEE